MTGAAPAASGTPARSRHATLQPCPQPCPPEGCLRAAAAAGWPRIPLPRRTAPAWQWSGWRRCRCLAAFLTAARQAARRGQLSTGTCCLARCRCSLLPHTPAAAHHVAAQVLRPRPAEVGTAGSSAHGAGCQPATVKAPARARARRCWSQVPPQASPACRHRLPRQQARHRRRCSCRLAVPDRPQQIAGAAAGPAGLAAASTSCTAAAVVALAPSARIQPPGIAPAPPAQ